MHVRVVRVVRVDKMRQKSWAVWNSYDIYKEKFTPMYVLGYVSAFE